MVTMHFIFSKYLLANSSFEIRNEMIPAASSSNDRQKRYYEKNRDRVLASYKETRHTLRKNERLYALRALLD
jgi:hypothetical protein